MTVSQLSTSPAAAGVRALSGGRTRKHAAGTASAASPLAGVRSFLSLAVHPFPRFTGAISGLIGSLVLAGGWYILAWHVMASSRHVSVQTPIGPKDLTVALSRWPQAAALGMGILAILFLIAGVRLQLQRERSAA